MSTILETYVTLTCLICIVMLCGIRKEFEHYENKYYVYLFLNHRVVGFVLDSAPAPFGCV